MTSEQIGLLIIVIVVCYMLGQAVLLLMHKIQLNRESKARERRKKDESGS